MPLALRQFVLWTAGWFCLTGSCVLAAPAEPLQPVPQTHNQDPRRVEIGRRLFNDPRLSANNTVSCASCHNLAQGGADGRVQSVGFKGQLTPVNAPTVLNAALNFRLFWNGRAGSLEEQIDAVIQNPIEMGSRWPDVVAKVAGDAGYRTAFAGAFADGVTAANIRGALAAYERTLLTPDSRFDRFLRGDAKAITPQERLGYDKFKQYGCTACHQGVNVGGNMFQRFGVMGDYFAKRGKPTEADLGRFLVTRDPADRHVFRVPRLRNVAQTAPYFHDGSAATLEEAVDVMFRYQLGRTASAEDKAAIVRFLHTLSAAPGGQAQ
jgi:cytochrome c peroxidase